MKQHQFRQHLSRLGMLLVGVLVLAGTVACNDGGAPTARAPFATLSAVEDACLALTKLSLPDTRITSTTLITGGGVSGVPVREYCRVVGTIEETINFEVALPRPWNGKFFLSGGGGLNGSIPSLINGVSRGYATAGSDTGHVGGYTDTATIGRGKDGAWALNKPEAQINYAHRATHLVTVRAKEIVRAYYGQKERFSFYLGCSNGGKMGLMEVQRYPEDLDGVVIGGAVIARNKLLMTFTWNAQALDRAPIPPEKVAVIAKATLAACDGQDGLVDGVIDSPDKCKFDPKTLTCPSPTNGGDDTGCLTPGQVTTLEKIYSGPRNSAGEQLYPGYPPGHEDDYPGRLSGSPDQRSTHSWQYQNDWMRYFVFSDPNYDSVKEFDFDRDPPLLKRLAEQDADNPDLSAFQARGGRLIIYNGWADHSTSPLQMVQYYNEVRKKHGESTDDFARLFLVPGFHHCSGGPGPNSFGGSGHALKDDAEHDIFRALERWVEQGIAPDKIIATKFVNDDPRQRVARTRPLCPYPQVARWKGTGSIDDAANFVCVTPR